MRCMLMAIVLIRTLIIYFALLITMRLLGKRQLGEMELSEFVLAALIADLAAHPLQDIGIPMINGLVPILTLFCCEVLIAGITLKSVKLRSIFFGRPSVLILRGKILQAELRKNRFSLDELMQELRNQGVLDISKIEYGILETDGKLNVILYEAHSPVTPAMLKLETSCDAYPAIIINDGRVMETNLHHLGRDMNWLTKQLNNRGAGSPEDVFLMTLNKSGQIYYSAKEFNRKERKNET